MGNCLIFYITEVKKCLGDMPWEFEMMVHTTVVWKTKNSLDLISLQEDDSVVGERKHKK